ncbi:MAG TPA: hypothetical protein VL995_03935 [Cellvibrio sp.]|nr:hypothetical protein [Cellvibrio sp.]
MSDEPMKETFIQKRAPYLVLIIITGLMALYFWNFNGAISGRQDAWGQFGDYVGGLINPMIGFITVWLLTVSMRQNHLMLIQANKELELARQALVNAKEMQAKTEETMAEQVRIADQTRDINNAIALFNRQDQTYIHLQNKLNADRQILPTNAEHINHIRKQIETCEVMLHHLGFILTYETERLMVKYPVP